MLDTVKSYIDNLPADSFEEFYQKYIFTIQDMNIETEVGSVKTSDILSLDKLIARLQKELIGK